jgi:CspA family cold shock protein
MISGQRLPFDERGCFDPTRLFVRLDETANLRKAMTPEPRRGMSPQRGGVIEQEQSMAVGTVKFFNTAKGYGFISPEGGGKDVFVHASAVEAAGMRTLNEGQKVTFDIQPDARGAKAVNLRAS